ncbi:MAG TPA: NADH-quinone oxidoreductase subunit NuoE [Rhodocyclaceae bacterium]|nr:NADH-quinone oxidoreductase subunit NuoE [Rhodocyclaceae bacterium]
MIEPDDRDAIEREIAHFPAPRAAAVAALKIVQARRGWVDDEALAELAALLAMSTAELDGIATFYSLIFRRPVGRHVILLCDSVSCWIAGCERLQAALCERLGVAPGEISAGGRFTLLPASCLGACDRAPVALIDRDLHTHLDPDNIDERLRRYE